MRKVHLRQAQERLLKKDFRVLASIPFFQSHTPTQKHFMWKLPVWLSDSDCHVFQAHQECPAVTTNLSASQLLSSSSLTQTLLLRTAGAAPQEFGAGRSGAAATVGPRRLRPRASVRSGPSGPRAVWDRRMVSDRGGLGGSKPIPKSLSVVVLAVRCRKKELNVLDVLE